MADIIKVLKAVDNLKKKGIIEDFIIGGGVAVSFYSQGIQTEDLDLYIQMPKNNFLNATDDKEIFKTLKPLGAKKIGPYIELYGIKIQFLFFMGGLIEEAFKNYKLINIDSTFSVKVEAPEYIIAIYLSLLRAKDIIKIHNLLRDTKIDYTKLRKILKKYDLITPYNELVKKFGLDTIKEQKIVGDIEIFKKKLLYQKMQATLPIKEKIKQINTLFEIGKQLDKIKKNNKFNFKKEKFYDF
jgi:hypothetical protein